MRFRAKIVAVPYFLRLMQSIEKIGKDLIIGLSPQKARFAQRETEGLARVTRFFLIPDQSGIKVWTELNMASSF